MLVITAVAGVVYIFIPHDDKADPVKAVDYRVELATARRAAPYPVVAPDGLAKGWKPTSVSYQGQNGSGWHLGFLDPDKKYVAVEQSTSPARKYVPEVSQDARDTGRTREVMRQGVAGLGGLQVRRARAARRRCHHRGHGLGPGGPPRRDGHRAAGRRTPAPPRPPDDGRRTRNPRSARRYGDSCRPARRGRRAVRDAESARTRAAADSSARACVGGPLRPRRRRPPRTPPGRPAPRPAGPERLPASAGDTFASSSPRSHRASDSSSVVPPASRRRTTSISSSRACS